MPDVAMWIGLIEHSTLAVEHRVMDGVAVEGVRRGSTQALVLKWPLAEVEDHKDAAEMRLPGIIFLPKALLEALHVRVGHVIDQMHLASAQGSQADRVLLFRFTNDLIEVGQVVALRVG